MAETWKLNDKVKVIDPDHPVYGWVGVIYRFEDGRVFVHFDPGHVWSFDRPQLRNVTKRRTR